MHSTPTDLEVSWILVYLDIVAFSNCFTDTILIDITDVIAPPTSCVICIFLSTLKFILFELFGQTITFEQNLPPPQQEVYYRRKTFPMICKIYLAYKPLRNLVGMM